jgi:low temperature requirement protein LtrA
LELLFDLTFVAAFGVAGDQLAHGIAENHVPAAVGAFAFAMVAIVWAWINYSWFASAFDTDDWLFRVLTMVQMAGVVVLAIGLPQMFASIQEGGPVANEVMVAGYVVMRVAVIAQWLRAAKGNPAHHAVAKTYALFIGIAQVGWVLLIVIPMDVVPFVVASVIVLTIDWAAPIVAESKGSHHGGSTPWNAHHIAERYSLLAIIALGETVLGTLAAAQAITAAEGWSFSSVMVVGLGVVMTFALWWVYFLIPSAPILAVQRTKALVWGYGHILVFAAIAAVGAGLHVVAYVYDEHYHVSTLTAISSIAIPVLVFMVSLYLLHAWLVSGFPKNAPLQISVLALPVIAIVLAAVGWPLWVCLLVLVVSPVAVVLSFELGAWRALEAQLVRVVERALR